MQQSGIGFFNFMPEALTYSQQLSLPQWQKKRLKIFERDGFACCYCGNKEDALHVHHKEYKYGKKAWEYPDENFLTLCVHCHDVIEFCKKSGYEIINCKLSCFADGGKAHLTCVTDYINGSQFCIIWEFNKNGDVNGKTIALVLPFKEFNYINEYINSNIKKQ